MKLTERQGGLVLISFPLQTPSQNVTLRWERTQPYLLTRHKKELADIVMVARAELGNPPKETRRMMLTVTREHTTRRLDRGNLIGGCKALIDALVRGGLLVNDSEVWLDDHYLQRKVSENPCTIVMLEVA